MSWRKPKPWIITFGLFLCITILLILLQVLSPEPRPQSPPVISLPEPGQGGGTPQWILAYTTITSSLATVITAIGSLASIIITLRKDRREEDLHRLEVEKQRKEMEKEQTKDMPHPGSA
jgi:hypothetical protein